MIALSINANMEQNNPATYYAPAERSDASELKSAYHSLKSNKLLKEFQEAMPDLAMIINKNRQLVYANSNLVRYLDIEDSQVPLGERLGNLLSCIHSGEEPGGCGTTKACRFCGVVNAVLEAQETGRPVVKEARITTVSESESVCFDLKVKASPLHFDDEYFTIVCINDISDKKRSQALKTVRISEMYDNAASLKSIVSSIKKEHLDEEDKSKLASLEKYNQELIFDLYSQKLMNEAEEGTLEKKCALCNSVNILKAVERHFQNSEVATGKKLYLDPFSHAVKFMGDENLVRRILISLVTNGLEAVKENAMVSFGARLNDKEVRFWIKTPVGLSEEEKLQIFQRSFSTKGNGRGLGTYLTKLIVTKCLKGNVYFSAKENENIFYIDIPLLAD